MMLMRAAAISVAALVLDATLSRRRNRVTPNQAYALTEIDGATTILTSERTIEVNVGYPADEISPVILSDYAPLLIDRAEHAADRHGAAVDWETMSFHVGPRDRDGIVLLILRAGLIR